MRTPRRAATGGGSAGRSITGPSALGRSRTRGGSSGGSDQDREQESDAGRGHRQSEEDVAFDALIGSGGGLGGHLASSSGSWTRITGCDEGRLELGSTDASGDSAIGRFSAGTTRTIRRNRRPPANVGGWRGTSPTATVRRWPRTPPRRVPRSTTSTSSMGRRWSTTPVGSFRSTTARSETNTSGRVPAAGSSTYPTWVDSASPGGTRVVFSTASAPDWFEAWRRGSAGTG